VVAPLQAVSCCSCYYVILQATYETGATYTGMPFNMLISPTAQASVLVVSVCRGQCQGELVLVFFLRYWYQVVVHLTHLCQMSAAWVGTEVTKSQCGFWLNSRGIIEYLVSYLFISANIQSAIWSSPAIALGTGYRSKSG
jgi:hypothetical protein